MNCHFINKNLLLLLFNFKKFIYFKRFFFSINTLKILNLFLIFFLFINYSKIQIIFNEWKNINIDRYIICYYLN